MIELDIGMVICCFMRKWLMPRHQGQQRKPELLLRDHYKILGMSEVHIHGKGSWTDAWNSCLHMC